MKIGDKIKVLPDFMHGEARKETSARVWARVVYIHPQRRYFTVEFTGNNGDLLRESYHFAHRGGVD